MIELQLSAKRPDWQAALADLAASTQDKVDLILDSVGSETVAYLKSLSEERRGWATITGELAGGYAYHIRKIPGGTRLTLRNDARHSVYLEARDGFFILSGVLDPGGPVEQALVSVIERVAPEMHVVRVRP